LDVARRYAEGERAAAVAEVGRFTQPELVAVLASLRAQAEAASCVGCAAPSAPLRAIVMLHTDRDEMEGRPAEMAGELSPTCGVRRHASFAERVLDYLRDDAPGRDFSRRWYLAMALRALEDTCLADGEAWARAGLKWFPRDAELLFAHGSLQERVAASASLTPPNAASLLPREREAVNALLQERRMRFDEARRAFEGAVAADPAMTDARLHLGRTLLYLERFEDARKALEVVAAQAGTKAETLYLARLFLGRVHESRGRLEAAVAEYEAAVSLDPSAQSAAVALSYAQQARGEAAEARTVLERGLEEAKQRRLPDPFWAYPLGRAAEHKEMFARLRREASP
jgi:tetratricopeptide (TPR) repeat protein